MWERGGGVCCVTDSGVPAVIFILRFMTLCPLCLSSVTNLLLKRTVFWPKSWGGFNVKSICVFHEMTKLNKCHQEMTKTVLFSLVTIGVQVSRMQNFFWKQQQSIPHSLFKARRGKTNPSPYPLAPPEGKHWHFTLLQYNECIWRFRKTPFIRLISSLHLKKDVNGWFGHFMSMLNFSLYTHGVEIEAHIQYAMVNHI